MKKFIAPLLVGAALTSGFAADDLKKEIEALKEPTAQLNHKNTPINSLFNGIKSTFRVQFLI